MDLRIEVFPADLDRFVDFYTGVLRFTLVTRRDDYAAVERDNVHIGAAVDTEQSLSAIVEQALSQYLDSVPRPARRRRHGD